MITNTVTVYIGGINYTNALITPLKGGNFLDERLDEAMLFLNGISADNFPPRTPVEIEIKNTLSFGANEVDTQAKTIYMVVANDSAEETIVGKGIYNHDLYVIEVTKAAELDICDTQTITNDLGRAYTESANYAQPVWLT